MVNYTHKQMHGNSCGSVCLMVCAKELGVINLPSHPVEVAMYYGGGAITMDYNTETRLYRGLTDGKSAGFTMPSAIIKAARLMNLNGELFVHGCH